MLEDKDDTFFKELVEHHVSGQLKVAPEHCSASVLDKMGKPHIEAYIKFSRRYFEYTGEINKELYLVPYLMSSLPGSTLDDAIEKKCNIIFTTTPQFLEGSIKTAIKNPSVKILNCSVDTNHQCIRTYYARLFEAKFLSGLVAGALCKNGKIGYMADYPICGMIANINAFAIGVKMVNPNATIQLEWTTVRSKQEILEDFKANEVNLVSCLEMIVPNSPSRYFGLVNIEKDEPENLTAVIWNWGALYKKLVETVQNGAWGRAGSDGVAHNYWWGMSAGVVDLIYSESLPSATKSLVKLFE